MADNDELTTRPQFGNRFLSDPTKVFEHNAWDNVEWDSQQEQAAQQKIDENSCIKLDEEQQVLYEEQADNFWDEFYMQHQNRFFKDRHWLFTEFPELSGPDAPILNNSVLPVEKCGKSCTTVDQLTDSEAGNLATSINDFNVSNNKSCNLTSEDIAVETFPGCQKQKRILEVGCGVGNTVFPILETNNEPDLFVYCCDFSSNAVNLVKEHPDFNPERCHAFVCDITNSEFVFPFPAESLDIIILIFVLSAIHPNKMQGVIDRLSKIMAVLTWLSFDSNKGNASQITSMFVEMEHGCTFSHKRSFLGCSKRLDLWRNKTTWTEGCKLIEDVSSKCIVSGYSASIEKQGDFQEEVNCNGWNVSLWHLAKSLAGKEVGERYLSVNSGVSPIDIV